MKSINNNNDNDTTATTKSPISIHEFVKQQKEYLDLELQSEQQEQQQNSGEEEEDRRATFSLSNLQIDTVSVGLYGRTVVEFSLYSSPPPSSSSSKTEEGDDENVNKKSKKKGDINLLPAHRLTVGDEVNIFSGKQAHELKSKKQQQNGGVVCAVTDTSISIALFSSSSPSSQTKKDSKSKKDKKKIDKNNEHHENEQEEENLGTPPFSLVPRSSIEVHRKIIKSLAELEKYGMDHPVAGHIVKAAFGYNNDTGIVDDSSSPAPPPNDAKENFNPNLNESQNQAIQFALSCSNTKKYPISLMHGPPGTGKTTTLVELVKRAIFLYDYKKILVTAPSNVAVDNILEKLVQNDKDEPNKKRRKKGEEKNELRVIRLGHPARIKPSILQHCLESVINSPQNDSQQLITDIKSELKSHLQILQNPKSSYKDRRTSYAELKYLRKELKSRQEILVQQVLSQAQVILCTNVGASSTLLDKIYPDGFDLVITDEAAQSLEASSWISLLRCKNKAILAGDHCQLPPTITSHDAKVKKALSFTLFERLMHMEKNIMKKKDMEKGCLSRLLCVQYRMNDLIANWSSKAMYDGRLVSHESVRRHTLQDLFQHDKDGEKTKQPEQKEVNEAISTIAKAPLFLIDTTGCNMYESTNTSSGSRYNEGEASLVTKHVKSLLQLGCLTPQDIAVITPYNGQVELLRSQLLNDYPTLEIKSVDGFQGGEREAVVLSLVRSSEEKAGGTKRSIGFLKERRRLNVAITRARRHVAVICDVETVGEGSCFIKGLIDWMEERGEYRSAMEFVNEGHGGIDRGSAAVVAPSEGLVSKMMQDAAGAATENFRGRKGDDSQATQIPKAQKLPSLPSKPAAATLNDTKIANKNDKESTPTTNDELTKEEEKGIRRKFLMSKIGTFAETRKKGETLLFDMDKEQLSKFDCLVIHELAEQLGLEHKVNDGKNQIVLKVLKEATVIAPSKKTDQKDQMKDNDNELGSAGGGGAFASLAVENDDEEDSSVSSEGGKSVSKAKPGMNSLLGSLAEERKKRQQQQQQEKEQQQAQKLSGLKSTQKSKKKRKKKGKGQKLGGTATAGKAVKESNHNVIDDIEDDMAFLDAQIEKVQTSHGRKVEGSGSGYRSIINGVLISKPPAREADKDARASSALKAKLRQAEKDRKVKGGKKKKK